MKLYQRILTTLLLLTLLIAAVPIQAQEPDCEPEEVKAWLIGINAWMAAFAQTFEGNRDPSPDAERFIYHKILFEMDHLPRPACADPVMYEVYSQINSLFYRLMCLGIMDMECVERAQPSEEDNAIFDELEAIAGINMDDYNDVPDGWDIDTEIARIDGEIEINSDEPALGTYQNPVPFETEFTFENGRVRLVSITDPFPVPESSYDQPKDGQRVIALGVEYTCEKATESCTGGEIRADALVTPDGVVLNSVDFFGDAHPDLHRMEAFTPNILSGNLYLKLPTTEIVNVVRLLLDYDDVYFALGDS